MKNRMKARSILMPDVKVAMSNFFDREKVMKAVNAAELKALRWQGGYVMKAAKASIRNARDAGQKTKRSSKPGETPRSQTGRFKRFIQFSYDDKTKSTVVGPSVLGGKGIIPPILEYGGDSRIALKRPKLGQGSKGRQRRFRWERTGKFATVHIAARPTMGPALTRSTPALARIWKDSIRGVK